MELLSWTPSSLRIKALGPHIEVWLNSKKIVDYQDAKRLAKHLAPGHLAIQTYGAENHAGWVKFRKMKIKPLIASQRGPE